MGRQIWVHSDDEDNTHSLDIPSPMQACVSNTWLLRLPSSEYLKSFSDGHALVFDSKVTLCLRWFLSLSQLEIRSMQPITTACPVASVPWCPCMAEPLAPPQAAHSISLQPSHCQDHTRSLWSTSVVPIAQHRLPSLAGP